MRGIRNAVGSVIRAALLAWAIFLSCIGPARAQTAAESLSVLCPRHGDLEQVIDAAAAKHRLQPVLLTALILAESSCEANKVNKHTRCYGLTGIKIDGSANYQHREPAELMDPETNVELGARHLARCLSICGSLGGALRVYHGNKRCDGWREDTYVRRVSKLTAKVRRILFRAMQPRS
jgi:hypothetical protein